MTRTSLTVNLLVERGWHFDRNTDPPSLHVMFSPAHLAVADELVSDLREAISAVSTAGAG